MAEQAAEARVRAAVAELAAALVALAGVPHETSADPVELVSPAEFARRAGIGRSSVYQAIANRSIRSTKLGGRRLVPVSELTRLADSA